MNSHHRCHVNNSKKFEKITGFGNSNIGREYDDVKIQTEESIIPIAGALF